ncbi:DUF2946 family protein [Sphaerotilaceae bacterium SBD11-9]
MRRWLAILLLVILPLQFSWVAAASLCQHEQDVSTQHVGHHEHQHKASSDKPNTATDAHGLQADKSDGKGKQSAEMHADCAYCQLSVTKPLSLVSVSLAGLPTAFDLPPEHQVLEFQPRDRIERPNWHRA